MGLNEGGAFYHKSSASTSGETIRRTPKRIRGQNGRYLFCHRTEFGRAGTARAAAGWG